jgi:hypothetical protein
MKLRKIVCENERWVELAKNCVHRAGLSITGFESQVLLPE